MWRVSQFGTRRPQQRRAYIKGLGRISVLDHDEDALVAFWPRQPLRCYQCGVTSDDPNPTYETASGNRRQRLRPAAVWLRVHRAGHRQDRA